ncbi:hypothetical protein FO519_000544 [Halicephalobus sp. NKZ332]|nr:hypothetical protein FO519_000544 [Halicephalobus sp. NKZ332]
MESGIEQNGQQKNPFTSQWNQLLSNLNDFEKIRRIAIQGGLRDSPMRTLYWRIMLGCIPLDYNQWKKTLDHDREIYENYKKDNFSDPDQDVFGLSLDVNNPLSLVSESPWNRYFVDENLKELIEKDVNRTFPEIKFFTDTGVRDMMKTVLFIYSKKNPELSYRQGMHEILAPILFTLHNDISAYCHYEELNLLPSNMNDRSLLRVINDSRYLEHDLYFIFSKIMNIIGEFYSVADELEEQPENSYYQCALESRKKTKAAWIEKLDVIYDMRLRDLDPQLWSHLKTLDISPRLFGLRWLRLLYGREFPFPDVLFLWDVIFSDKPSFDIIDDIFVAMLIQIRRLLLNADYSTALQFLMRYPPIADVHSFVAYCLHLRFPTKFSKPSIYGVTHFSHITVAGKPHPNLDRKEKRTVNGSAPKLPLTSISVSASAHETESQNISKMGKKNEGEQTARSNGEMLEELELLKEQVALLQSSLNDKDLVSRVSASRILKLIPELEEVCRESARISGISEEMQNIANSLSGNTVPNHWIRNVATRSEQCAVEIQKDGSAKFRPRSQSGSTNNNEE